MLKGKTAVITGSTSGIGFGVAEVLASSGCAIILNSFTDTEDNYALADDLASKYDTAAAYIQADMSDPGQCTGLIEAACKRFGQVDILVNNAGIQYVAPLEEFPAAKWDAIVAINMSSAFHTTRIAVTGMKKRGWGRIINISSAHGLTASPFKSAYVAAKHGLVGLTKVTALEMADARVDVTCNAICPGYVWTPLVEQQLNEQMSVHELSKEEIIDKVMLTRQPTRTFASAQHIGEMVKFLCTDAASQVTGTTLSVDGGWTAL